MTNNVLEDVGIVVNEKIKTPVKGDAGLPSVSAFVILFGAQGRVAQILEQQQRLFVKGLLDFLGCLAVAAVEVLGAADLHRGEGLVLLALSFLASRWRSAINFAWVSNTRDTRPDLISASALARRASMTRRWAGVYSSSMLVWPR